MSERIDKIKAAIEKRFGGVARHVTSRAVRDTFKGTVVWEGIVETFDLDLNPQVKRAYGLMYREGEETRYATTAATDEINSPELAVKAFVASTIQK